MFLHDRVAFITGASRGIGRACAVLLADAGARVVLASRDGEKLEALAHEICLTHGEGQALAAVLDVAQDSQIEQVFRTATQHFGKVDILVNNAGVTRDGLLVRMKRQDWDQVIQTNLTAAYRCIQEVLPGMIRRRQGRIINITSVVASTGNPGQANYVASKAGIIGLTRALAVEVASRNITVNAVAPGFIETAMTDAMPTEAREQLAERIPLRRLGQPIDIAHAVKFLASDDAGYITGQVLHVNGGLFLGG